jgi:glyoxylase-like metal-dependent hydrolase (beta-lactamase superfamily II)
MNACKRLLFGVLLVAGCGPSPLDEAIDALGGHAALAGWSQMTYSSSGLRYAPGQAVETLGDPREAGSFASTTQLDLDADALRVELARDVRYPFMAALAHANVVRGELGYVGGTDNVIGAPERPMGSAQWAALRKEHVLRNPLLILRHALEHPEMVATGRDTRLDREPHRVLSIRLPESYGGTRPVQLYFSAVTGLISKLTVVENDHLLRDVELEVTFADWTTVDGTRMPRSVTLAVGGQRAIVEQRSGFALDPGLAPELFAFPDGADPRYVEADARRAALSHQWHEEFRSLGLPFDALETTVTPTELAPGVFHLTGAVHHSLVIEQRDGIVVIEAPLYPERADAIIAWVKDRFPGRPIARAVATHHHVDHSAGLRSFVAEGAEIVASARAEALYRTAFAARSTVSPDRLSREPRTPRLALIDDAASLHIDDPERPIDVHHIASSHADDLVIISLPRQGIVFQSDLYSPGFPLNAQLAGELRNAIIELGLDGTLLAGGHGNVSSFAELEAALAPAN